MPASVASRVVEVKRARPRGWNPGGEPAAPSSDAQTATHPEVTAERASATFAHHVRKTLVGPILRYTQRVAFLKHAEALGVGRFEANLVIAKVLNEQGMGQEIDWRPDRARRGWGLPLGAFVLVQGLVFAGMWWLLRG